ncbi:DUF6053 domain-containing protein [Lysobacter sp. CA199]|uniref:DUF6053 domain-containing protein n=1 Tax=Lysobacter sp. CA199 TaxID=3455608 RepID=UPI003F8D4CCB
MAGLSSFCCGVHCSPTDPDCVDSESGRKTRSVARKAGIRDSGFGKPDRARSFVGGASAPTLFGQVLPTSESGGSDSVGAEAPPTKDLAVASVGGARGSLAEFGPATAPTAIAAAH